MLKLPVYLDNNATTPCDPRVLETMLPYFTEQFGNAASRSHLYGWQAEEAVEVARQQIASVIGAHEREMVFTSGATEAINLALKGVFEAYAVKGNHIITVGTEHKAVLDSCKHLEKIGAEISYLKVDSDGLINLDELKSAIKSETILIAVMYANNETGVIQPVAEIGKLAKQSEDLFFTDASQAAGKIDIDVERDGIDLLALSAHKMYGPKGTGALYVRRKNPRVRLIAQIDGGGHEKGMRSGTLNTPAIVGFGKAAEVAQHEMSIEAERLSGLRNRLQAALMKHELVQVNGSEVHRLPHTLNLSFGSTETDALLRSIAKDIAVSSGSACTSASMEPSYVLNEMGISDELAYSSIRFGLGRFTTEEEIEFVIKRVSQALEEIMGYAKANS